ncbi:MAG: AtpZ/AtpI family protein [Erysipelotrichaceae bacterium]
MLETVYSARSKMREYQKAIKVISTMAITCVLALFIGHFIDQCLHTTPFFLIALLFYAIGGNLYQLFKDTGEDK